MADGYSSADQQVALYYLTPRVVSELAPLVGEVVLRERGIATGRCQVWPHPDRPRSTTRDSNPAIFAADFEREILKSSRLKFSCFREKRRFGAGMGADGVKLDFEARRHGWCRGAGKLDRLSVKSRVGSGIAARQSKPVQNA